MRLETTIEAGGRGAPGYMHELLSELGDAALAAEGLAGQYGVFLLLTDDKGIRAINRRARGLDRATDVLSFPSVRYKAGTARDNSAQLRREYDPQTRCVHLGDVVLSVDRALEQAAAFGHSLAREMGFLFVHGLLHLLGYDHEEAAQGNIMRGMEEDIMNRVGLDRTLTDDDFTLVSTARKAMELAYAPYSHYRVGACVRAADGRLFKGCNVENASFGLSICAERNAMTTAVAEGATAFTAIAIAAEGAMPSPCGACRQFMREFARDMRVILVNGESIQETTLSRLLPDSFGPEALGKES
ncbi:MAG: cytidine deaminase [Firmicutes bacterium]|nr:cytidine deaminase [Bacillota bacterium]